MLDSTRPIMTRPPAGSMFLRLVWFWALPAMLVALLLVALDGQPPWTIGLRDAALLVVVIAGISARAVDALWLGGTTAEGDPASRGDVRRYAFLLGLGGLGAWLAAQSVPF